MLSFSYIAVTFRGGSAGGLGGSSPYSWCINENMGRVRRNKRWRKEEKWRERKKKRPASFNPILHSPLDGANCMTMAPATCASQPDDRGTTAPATCAWWTMTTTVCQTK